MSSPDLPDYLRVNREAWTKANAEYTDSRAPQKWAQPEIDWGIWSIPEARVRVLPDLDGKPFALESLRGQKVVLVAWEPY